jgi:hypothetical protein
VRAKVSTIRNLVAVGVHLRHIAATHGDVSLARIERAHVETVLNAVAIIIAPRGWAIARTAYNICLAWAHVSANRNIIFIATVVGNTTTTDAREVLVGIGRAPVYAIWISVTVTVSITETATAHTWLVLSRVRGTEVIAIPDAVPVTIDRLGAIQAIAWEVAPTRTTCLEKTAAVRESEDRGHHAARLQNKQVIAA